ncbi:MAG: hypothetical protein H6658_13400 [Ardenticatenaceae bacterium]|nr:hypothetical protein [Ardenticatenaceae bacterium]
MTVRRLFVLLFVVALFAMAVRETLDPDMWWHLRTGEAILAGGIPTHDIFSFTVPEHEWVTHEWGAQVFMWLVYVAGGLPALIVVFALLIALTFWLLFLSCEGRPYLAGFVVLLAAVTSAIVWGARPQIFNLLLTAVFIYIIEGRLGKERRAQREGRAALPSPFSLRSSLWLLPILTAVWANLHSGYLLGVVLIGTYAVGEAGQRFLQPSDERSLGWGVVGSLFVMAGLSFAAAVLNPSGAALWLYPFETLGSPAMQAYIQEWHSPDFHLRIFWPFVVMLGVGVLSWVYGGKRPSVSELLLFGGTGAAGLISARNIPIFAIISAPIVARHVLILFTGTAAYPLLSGQEGGERPSGVLGVLNWVVLVAALFGAFVWTANTVILNEVEVAAVYPVTAVDYLEESGLAEMRGYNSYNWGGYLIWRGVRVFVDGRADVYGDDFLFYYRRTFELRENWQEPLDDFAVDYVLMERDSPLAIMLLNHEGWQEAYADDLARIFVRAN